MGHFLDSSVFKQFKGKEMRSCEISNTSGFCNSSVNVKKVLIKRIFVVHYLGVDDELREVKDSLVGAFCKQKRQGHGFLS